MAKRKFVTHHSSDNAIVKSKRKMPYLMTLENAYISFVENNIKDTWKTFFKYQKAIFAFKTFFIQYILKSLNILHFSIKCFQSKVKCFSIVCSTCEKSQYNVCTFLIYIYVNKMILKTGDSLIHDLFHFLVCVIYI